MLLNQRRVTSTDKEDGFHKARNHYASIHL